MAARDKAPSRPSKDSTTGARPKLIPGSGGRDLDRLIHERTRLAIVSALAANQSLSFNDLKSALKISDGNLSAHARKLEDAGYIRCSKGFEGRLPKTEYSLTGKGKQALSQYIGHMEALIASVKME